MNGSISSTTLLSVIFCYFILLIIISHFTSKNATNQTFFSADRKSPWYLVAFGMIGASISGVTLISIPGVVGAGGANMSFSYMQMVFGYLIGYAVIALVLMPVYYRLNLTSIYSYLETRFGNNAYKTGAAFFLLSRLVGSSFRLFLMAIILQQFVMDAMGVPFQLTVFFTIALIWVYTFRAGIKTIVWTDTLQTTCMILAVVFTIIAIGQNLGFTISDIPGVVRDSDYSQMFFFDGGWSDPNNFWKQLISGALIAIVMTGLDQDMMQKNLTCKTLKDAQKNIFTFSIILVFVNLLFLSLGVLLYLYAQGNQIEIPTRTDQLFPLIALTHLPTYVGILFILGLIAAAYSSADSALTALTTSFCIDFLNFEKEDISQEKQKSTRFKVHIMMSVILLVVILLFEALNNDAIINMVFKAAGYTYGPLLGLFSFGLLTRIAIKDKYAWVVCLSAPVLSYIIDANSEAWFGGFQFGFLIVALNGALTFLGLLLIARR